MIEVRQTDRFACWLAGLRDQRGRARVQARIERLRAGNPGDVKPIGSGVSELRGSTLIILLAGGDKATQAQDIQTALELAPQIADERP